MDKFLTTSIQEIMTDSPVTAHPDMIMTEVAKIFELNNFHHLPVLNEQKKCVGIISKSDYLLIQDKFTKFSEARSTNNNQKFLRSLLVSEVMSEEIVSIKPANTVNDAIKIFLKNNVHSVIVANESKFLGIVTPYDILSVLNLKFS